MKLNHSWGCVIILFVLTAALYGQFLWNPIVFDDLSFFIVDAQGKQPISSYHYSLLELRSLPYASLAWGKELFGLELLHFRVENMLLHVAVVLALFFFLSRLFEVVEIAPNQTSSFRTAAFWGALLFALHPVAVYAVGYLVQRSIVMSTFFCLLAMLSYLHGSVRQKTMWLWASAPLYYLAVFSKEHAIMLPAVLVAMTILLHEDWKSRLKHRWALFLAFTIIALWVVAARIGVLGSIYEVGGAEMAAEVDTDSLYPLSVLTQAWLFFKYVALWLFPNPAWMSIDMREPFAQSWKSSYLLAFMGFLSWGACAYWLLLKRGRSGLVGFAMLFPWLMFMTEFSTVRIQESFVLYRSYIWAVGSVCVLPVLVFNTSILGKRVVSGLFIAVALTIFIVSMERLSTFSHPLLLWDDAEKLVAGRDDLPGAARIYNNRGLELLKTHNYREAIGDFKRAIELLPSMPSAHNNLGATYLELGQWQTAIASFSKAIEIMKASDQQWDSRPFLGRAKALEALGQIEDARRDYQVSCRLAQKGCKKL